MIIKVSFLKRKVTERNLLMRKLKKIAYLFLTVIICVIFIGCGKKSKKTPQLICHGILTFHGFQVTGEIIWFQKLSQKKQVAPYLLLHQQVILTKN